MNLVMYDVCIYYVHRLISLVESRKWKQINTFCINYELLSSVNDKFITPLGFRRATVVSLVSQVDIARHVHEPHQSHSVEHLRRRGEK